MRKKIGLLNTMFWGLLIFMFLGLSNVHAATLDWGTADPLFVYEASIDCFAEPPWIVAQESETYQYLYGTPVDSINSRANVSVTPLTDVTLKAEAFGGILSDGASSSALVSFDINTDINGSTTGLHVGDDSIGDSYGGNAVSWIKRVGLTVDAPGLFNLHGIFNGSINFDDDNPLGVYANATWEGGIWLYERIEAGVGGSSSLATTWFLDINDIINGTVREVELDNETDDERAIHYNLLVGFTGTGLQADLSNWVRYGDISADSNYDLGNSRNPFSLEGYLTPVPLPGTMMLLFSGIAGLFGFKLSLLRRGSSNNQPVISKADKLSFCGNEKFVITLVKVQQVEIYH